MTEKSTDSKNAFIDGVIPTTLRKMTVPVVWSMIVLMSFNLVDTFFIGLLGTEPLAAISFTFPVTFAVISLVIGMGIGTSAVIAKALGSGDVEDAKYDGTAALLLSALMTGLLALSGFIFIEPIFKVLGAKPELMKYITDYMHVWLAGSFMLVFPMVGNSILRASGDTKTPSLIMTLGGLVNAILDPLLIFGLGPFPELGVQGAALATIISWILGSITGLYILGIRRCLIHLHLKSFKQFIEISRKLLQIGLPAAGANMLTPLGTAILTAMIATYGKEAVAAFGVVSRIESIAVIVALALTMTLPPFISQNFGANRLDRVKIAYTTVTKFILVWQIFVYALLVLFRGPIARVFSKEPAVQETIELLLMIFPLCHGVYGVTILTNSSFNAMHKPNQALILNILRYVICVIPFAYVGSLLYGLEGLGFGVVLGNAVIALVSNRWFMSLFKACDFKANENNERMVEQGKS
ncbi:MATE family efflux transporter [Algicola sagamiensis]|uniref:MATE family efflux transporter n=1 Tax=Algicola sagamiensis TaxID=163869 RepID=UPI00039D5171|nr:MATE family efflux transporter [Algicola sagamiensis]